MRIIVPRHGDNPNTRNGARLQFPSPIMAPDFSSRKTFQAELVGLAFFEGCRMIQKCTRNCTSLVENENIWPPVGDLHRLRCSGTCHKILSPAPVQALKLVVFDTDYDLQGRGTQDRVWLGGVLTCSYLLYSNNRVSISSCDFNLWYANFPEDQIELDFSKLELICSKPVSTRLFKKFQVHNIM